MSSKNVSLLYRQPVDSGWCGIYHWCTSTTMYKSADLSRPTDDNIYAAHQTHTHARYTQSSH